MWAARGRSLWSEPGAALVAVLLVLVVGGPPLALALFAGGTLVALPLLGWLERGWWLVAAMVLGGVAAARLPRGWAMAAIKAGAVGALAWALPGLFDLFHIDLVSETLLLARGDEMGAAWRRWRCCCATRVVVVPMCPGRCASRVGYRWRRAFCERTKSCSESAPPRSRCWACLAGD